MLPEILDRIDATGQLCLSEPGALRRRTAGGFGKFVQANAALLEQALGHPVYPGSLNVEIGEPLWIHYALDTRALSPALTIPRAALAGMKPYLGEAAAWRAELHLKTAPAPIPVWVFRRLNSRMHMGVLELLARARLRDRYSLRDRDPVDLTIHAGAAVSAAAQIAAVHAQRLPGEERDRPDEIERLKP